MSYLINIANTIYGISRQGILDFWILTTGLWRDDGKWEDTDIWND